MLDLKNLHPLDYLRIIWRRKWYVLTIFLVVSAGTAVYAWLMPDVYSSSARIRVETPTVPQDYVRPSVRSSPEDQIVAIRSMVQSRSFLQRMIQDFQLFGYGTSAEFSSEEAIRTIASDIEVAKVSADTFSIGFSSSDPQLAQNLTRRMVETLIQSNTSSRKGIAIETDRFMDEQLRQTQQNLLAVEEKIKQFKMEHLGALPEESAANLSALGRLDGQLASVENSLLDLQQRKRLLGIMAQNQEKMTGLSEDFFLPEQDLPSESAEVAAVRQQLEARQAELAALSLKYTPQYPDVMRLTREVELLQQKLSEEREKAAQSAEQMTPLEEQSKISQPETQNQGLNALPSAANLEMESINNDIKRKEKERETILGEMKKIQAKLNLSPALEQQLLVLSREHDTFKSQYDSLRGKKFQAQMTATLETNENNNIYRVVDEANLPEKPTFPNRVQMILLGIAAGFGLGIGAAFGREFLDTTLSSEDEVTKVLNLPVLGTISEIPPKAPRLLVEAGQMPKSA
jgi:polysaccharide chain length determinant protein (PEP-CTERM system associated)